MLGNAGETELDLRFQILGIPVRVHPGFWLMGAFICWQSAEGRPDRILIGVICVFFSILIHELGHAITFRRYGHRGEIVLYMMGGYATGKPLSTWRNVMVSAAGPAAGFVVATIVWVLMKSIPAETFIQHLSLYWTLNLLWFVNFWWGILNLTPCIPLDGGRIMESLVYRYWPQRANIKVLWICIMSSGAVALIGAQQQRQFLMIMFGIMCAQHVMALNQRNRFR
jgi:Zn-dependent protease